MNKLICFLDIFLFILFKLNKTNRPNVEPTIRKNNDIKMQMTFIINFYLNILTESMINDCRSAIDPMTQR